MKLLVVASLVVVSVLAHDHEHGDHGGGHGGMSCPGMEGGRGAEGGGEGHGGGGAGFNPMKKYMDKIPECKKLVEENPEGGYKVPNLPDTVNACFKAAHHKAKCCVMMEMKEMKSNPEAKKCYKKHKDHHVEWMRASCKWHDFVNRCMDGKPAFTPDHEHDHDNMQNELDEEFDRFSGMKHKECWADVVAKTKECKAQAEAASDLYKICNGENHGDLESASENEQKWHKIVMHQAKAKRDRTKEMQVSYTCCMGNQKEGTVCPVMESSEDSEEEAAYRLVRRRFMRNRY